MRAVLSVLFGAVTTSLLGKVAEAKLDIPTDFAAYKEWLDTAPQEDKLEHFKSISPKFIEEHGEDADRVRLCVNIEQNWMGLDNWVDQKWRASGVRFLDDKRYSDWVVGANAGDKPWVIMFAYTPLYMGSLNQPTDNMMRNLACLAKVYGDRINFGFMDFRASEKVSENYDINLDYGKITPAIIAFDHEKAYPANLSTLSAQKLAYFVENFKTDCQFCGQKMREPRTELTMYLEYTKNTLANSEIYVDTYNFLQEKTNNTWVHDSILAPYFGPKVGKKQVGNRILFWIIVPTIALTYELLSCLCCKAKKDDKKKKKKPVAKKTTTPASSSSADSIPKKETTSTAQKGKAAASPSKRGKREKLE